MLMRGCLHSHELLHTNRMVSSVKSWYGKVLHEVNNHLFCHFNIQRQSIVVSESSPSIVVSSANLIMWFELSLAVQSLNSTGLSTQP